MTWWKRRAAPALGTAEAAREAKILAREEERRVHTEERTRQEEARRAARAAEGLVAREQHLEGAVAAFEKMGEEDRRSFLRQVVDGFPASSFIDVLTANKPRRLDYDRADIYLRVTSKVEGFRIHACAKEPFTIEWIHGQIRAGDVLYDIGANVGAYSLVAAKQPGDVRVFAFEPGYANLASLYANIALNAATHQVTPMPIALSNRTAMDVFHLRDLQPGGARHTLGGAAAGPESPAQQPESTAQPVMTFRLDDLVETFGLPQPTHIKLDVDGGEIDVIEGARRTLTSPLLRSLLIEVPTDLSDAVAEALAPSGLRLHSKIDRQNTAGEFAVWYGVFGR